MAAAYQKSVCRELASAIRVAVITCSKIGASCGGSEDFTCARRVGSNSDCGLVPLNALVIPVYLLLNQVGQVDSLPGVIAYYLAIVLPFMVWTLRGFVANVPIDLEEAAMVDGATRVGAFLRIVFPLVAPGLVATAIYGFIQAWNEYIIAYVLLSSNSKQTLTIWLASFTTQHGTDWGGLMAGATLTALPVVVFFLIVQRRMTSGLVAGAVKG